MSEPPQQDWTTPIYDGEPPPQPSVPVAALGHRQSTGRRPGGRIVGVAVLVLLLAAAFVLGRATASGGNSKTATFAVHGSFILTSVDSISSDGTTSSGGSCSGTGGYSDIADGAQVVVTDQTGATVAIGDIEDGSHALVSCTFHIVVTGVPAGKTFYKLEIGHRGGIQFTEAQMRQGPDVTLGG